MKTIIKVSNIKCGGCANSIHKALATITGIFGVNADNQTGEITVDHTDEVSREQIAAKLLSLGYPEEGSVSGFTALRAGAKSFVSCAVGRFENMKKQ